MFSSDNPDDRRFPPHRIGFGNRHYLLRWQHAPQDSAGHEG
jgi:hypothetical protein